MGEVTIIPKFKARVNYNYAYAATDDLEKEPNAKTRKVLDESDAGIGLISCKDAEDLFKQLGIK